MLRVTKVTLSKDGVHREYDVNSLPWTSSRAATPFPAHAGAPLGVAFYACGGRISVERGTCHGD